MTCELLSIFSPTAFKARRTVMLLEDCQNTHKIREKRKRKKKKKENKYTSIFSPKVFKAGEGLSYQQISRKESE